MLSWLSSYAVEIVSSTIVAAVAFVLGNFRHAIMARVRTRKTRRYWGPLRSRGVAIVLGSFTPAIPSPASEQHRAIDGSALDDFEPYGLVGFGDVMALLAIQRHLQILEFDDVLVTHSKDLQVAKTRNLVLIGGPDPNDATDLAMRSNQLPIVFEDMGANRTQMRVEYPDGESASYQPMFAREQPSRLVRDFGFVAQVASPFDHESIAVLLVGVYGAAVAAAAHLVTTSYGVSRIMQTNSRRCIAVFHADVNRSGDVGSPQIERCTALPAAPQHSAVG